MLHYRRFMAIIAIAILSTISVPLAIQTVQAGEPGLGYSEGPFELIENPTSATGSSPLEALQAAAANPGITITEEAEYILPIEDDQYAFIAVTADYIGTTAVLVKPSGDDWQFLCREAGVMPEFRMVENCGVPTAIATLLYDGLLEELEK